MQSTRRRQDPVSCRLRRSKKLRCDRQQPCANCAALGVDCEQPGPPARRESTVLARPEHLEEAVESLRKANRARSERDVGRSQAAARRSTDVELELVPAAHMAGASSPMSLPAKHEAVGLFYHYCAHVNYPHHVIHTPSGLALLDRVYGSPLPAVEPAHAALVLAVLAVLADAAYFWNPAVAVFAAAPDAQRAAGAWLEAALEMLHRARRTAQACLEEVQASVIAAYLVYNLEGFSERFRLLNTHALGLARDLSLHRIDGRPGAGPPESPVQSEVKRRVWWHIVSLDWLLAFTPGPQEGTYLAQPRPMAVRLPQNVDDQHLEQGGQELPPAQPTTMAYPLQRVRLADVCRQIADAANELHFDLRQMDCSTLRALDGRFERFFDGLPPFFRLDEASRHKSRAAERQFPHFSTQRYLIHLGAHTRRSRLQQPWLVRGSREPPFAFAREACLLSSRTVLQVARLIEQDGSDRPFAPPARLCTVVHHVTLAAVLLVVDLHFTKLRGPDEEQRNREIADACQTLERARGESAVAERLFASLDEVLQRHKVRLPPARPVATGPATTDGARHQALPVLGAAGQGEAAFDTLLPSDMDLGQLDLDIPA